MKTKIFSFAGITGYGKTITEAKANCEAKIKHLLTPQVVLSLQPVYIIKPYQGSEDQIGSFEYHRQLPNGDNEAYCLTQKMPDDREQQWMINRLEQIEAGNS